MISLFLPQSLQYLVPLRDRDNIFPAMLDDGDFYNISTVGAVDSFYIALLPRRTAILSTSLRL